MLHSLDFMHADSGRRPAQEKPFLNKDWRFCKKMIIFVS